METRVRGFLGKTFRAISTPFEAIYHDLERHKGFRIPGALATPATDSPSEGRQTQGVHHYPESQTQNSACGPSHVDCNEEASTMDATSGEAMSAPEDPAVREPRFVDPPNRIIAIHEEGLSSLLFGLTEETVTHIIKTIQASRAFSPIEGQLEELRRSVDINKTRIELMNSNLDDPEILESNKCQIAETLEERELLLKNDVERKENLERGFDLEAFKLKLLKDEVLEIFEHILMGAGFLEDPATKTPENEVQRTPRGSAAGQYPPDSAMVEPKEQYISDSVGLEPHEAALVAEDAEAIPSNELQSAEAVAAREEYDEACNRAREAELAFAERQQVYEQDLHEYGDSAPRTEIDLFHVQRNRDLARDLTEAEGVWERARDRAKALGVLSNNSYQTSNFIDDVDDGYRLSQDPSSKAVTLSRGTIEVWVDKIPEEDIGDYDEPMLDVDDWEDESIGPSDSLSVVASGRQRSHIDRWRSVCEAIPEG